MCDNCCSFVLAPSSRRDFAEESRATNFFLGLWKASEAKGEISHHSGTENAFEGEKFVFVVGLCLFCLSQM